MSDSLITVIFTNSRVSFIMKSKSLKRALLLELS